MARFSAPIMRSIAQWYRERDENRAGAAMDEALAAARAKSRILKFQCPECGTIVRAAVTRLYALCYGSDLRGEHLNRPTEFEIVLPTPAEQEAA